MKYMKFGIDRSLSTAETGEAGSKKASYNSKDMDLKVMGSQEEELSKEKMRDRF